LLLLLLLLLLGESGHIGGHAGRLTHVVVIRGRVHGLSHGECPLLLLGGLTLGGHLGLHLGGLQLLVLRLEGRDGMMSGHGIAGLQSSRRRQICSLRGRLIELLSRCSSSTARVGLVVGGTVGTTGRASSMATVLHQVVVLGLRLHLDRGEGSSSAGTGGRRGLLVQRLAVGRRSVIHEIRLVGQRELLLLLRQDRCLLQLLQLLGVHGAGGEEGRRLQPAMAKEGKSGKPISGSSTGRRNCDLISGGHTALIWSRGLGI